MSLKVEIYNAIKSLNGKVLTCEQLEVICRKRGRKISNAERRLRELVAEGKVETLMSSKHHITGYYHKEVSYPSQSKLGFAQ